MRSAKDHSGPIAALLLVAATLAVYWQVGTFDFTTHDDDDYVTQNEQVGRGLTKDGLVWAFTTFAATNWHPLTWISHMADVELFGLAPSGHHRVNLLLHVTNALLLYLLLLRLGGGVWPAALVASLFALHPIQVESVAWIAERKNVLCALFWLWAMLAHVAYARLGGLLRYLSVLALLALGLLAKPMVVTMPFALLLLDVWPLARFTKAASSRNRLLSLLFSRPVLEKIPHLFLATACAWLTVRAQRAGGAVQELETFGAGARLANAVVSYSRYLGKLVWPVDLALEYPHPGLASGGTGWSAGAVSLSLALLFVLSAAALLAGRSARYRYLAVGWLWYLGTLVPVIGLVQVGSQAMADRYAYIPFIGLFLIAGWGAKDLVSMGRLDRRVVAGSAVVIVCACLFLSWRQTALWRDSETIYQHSLARAGESWKILYELAALRSSQGKLDEALGYFERAVRVNPTNSHLQRNLGVLLQQRGRREEAITHFEAAVRASPRYVRGHFALGLAYAAAGRPAEGAAELREAIRLDDTFAEAHQQLGQLLARSGRSREALASLERAASLRPDWALPMAVMAEILATHPDPDIRAPARALELAERAMNLPGGDESVAVMALAGAYYANGRISDAIATAERAERRAIEKSQPVLAERLAREIERYREGN